DAAAEGVAAVDRDAALEQGVGGGRPAVVLQQRVEARRQAVEVAPRFEFAAAVFVEVEAPGDRVPVAAGGVAEWAGDDRVADDGRHERVEVGAEGTARRGRRVAGHGGAGEFRFEGRDPTARGTGLRAAVFGVDRVAADRAELDLRLVGRQQPSALGRGDAAAPGRFGEVAADRAAFHGQRLERRDATSRGERFRGSFAGTGDVFGDDRFAQGEWPLA